MIIFLASVVIVYLSLVALGAARIVMTRPRRPRDAATMQTYLFAAGSLLMVPVIGLLIELIGVVVAVGAVMAAPFTVGGTLLVALAVIVGIFLELVSVVLAVTKICMVMAHSVSGTVSDRKAAELIQSSYFFALLGFISIGAIAEIAEFADLGELADLEGLSDLEPGTIQEIDSDGFGPADDTYGRPSMVDGDPRTSHYVEGYFRDDGTWVDGHWKSKGG